MPLYIIGAIVLVLGGIGIGWSLRGQQALVKESVAATEHAVPSGARSELGSAAPGEAGGGSAAAGGGGSSARPLSLSPAQVMADLVRILEQDSGDDPGHGANLLERITSVDARLVLLQEMGAEGRQAMLDFLKRNEDYPLHGTELRPGSSSLRSMVTDALTRQHTPESEEAMRYLVETSPYLQEALKGVNKLSEWKVELEAEQREQLRDLAREKLQEASQLTGTIRSDDLLACGVAARELQDEALLLEMEQVYAHEVQRQNRDYGDYLALFVSMDGAAQQKALERIGPGHPLRPGLTQDVSELVFADFGQPAVQELVTDFLFAPTQDLEQVRRLVSDDTMYQLATVNVSGERGGFGSRTSYSRFESEAQKDWFFGRINGAEELLKSVHSQHTDTNIRALAAIQLEKLAKQRQDALNWTVKQPDLKLKAGREAAMSGAQLKASGAP